MKTAFFLQKLVLNISYYFFCLFVREDTGLWVIGVDEIANQIHYISEAFDKKRTVKFNPTSYYSLNKYDFDYSRWKLRPFFHQRLRYLLLPVLLGYLTNKASGFFYIWNTGFLVHQIDGRHYEFSFLKKKKKKIATFFCGADIRSIDLSFKQAKEQQIDVMATYLVVLNERFATADHEDNIRKTAHAAELYADYIFNAPADHITYIEREVHAFRYFYPDSQFFRNDDKFLNPNRITILHAPSSPFIKGTPLVRAAIKQLQVMGYDFEYIEIINQSNEIVLEQLKTAHIVVNELYSFAPGMFGIEAMASHCALVTSATREIEYLLPAGSDEAWFVTRYWEIFDHLRVLLDEPERIKRIADAGFNWTLENYRLSHSRGVLQKILDISIRQDISEAS
jgi:hypothetical protein